MRQGTARQGEAYLLSRSGRRAGPSGFYSVGTGGAITITDMPGFLAHSITERSASPRAGPQRVLAGAAARV
jgi:hypothetical protein